MERSAAVGVAAPVEPSHEEVTRFAALPVAKCPLQLCDLADVHIQTIIQKPAQLTSCNMKTGAVAAAAMQVAQLDWATHQFYSLWYTAKRL